MDTPVAVAVAGTAAPPNAEATPGGRRLRATLLPRLALALLAGLVLYAAFPPAGLWPAAPVGVAALALAVRGAGARTGALAGLVTGLALFVPLLRWSGLEVGAGPWLALAVLEAAFVVPLGAALALVSRLPGWPLWGAALWVADEALRARLPFGGFPWGRLAFSQGEAPLLPVAALGGAPLVSFAVALVGGALALVVSHRSVLSGVVAAGTTAGVVAAAVAAVVLVPAGTAGERGVDTVSVAVVQGNVPRLGLAFNAQRAAVLANHVEATRELAADVRAGRLPAPDLVVWPENSSDIDPFEDPEAYAAIDAVVREVGVTVLVGAVLQGPGEMLSNAGIVWDPVTGPGERYVKRHPVPFGEYIPLRSLARAVTDQVDLVARDFVAGDEVGVLDVGPVRLGDVICFEVAYDDLVRDAVQAGGRLLVVQTNNATFGRSPQTEQQLVMSRLRAVEHRRAVVVAATSGVSAVIRPDGSVAHRAEVFTRDVSVTEVAVSDDRTPATRLGGAPELALSLLGAGAVAVVVRRRAAA